MSQAMSIYFLSHVNFKHYILNFHTSKADQKRKPNLLIRLFSKRNKITQLETEEKSLDLLKVN